MHSSGQLRELITSVVSNKKSDCSQEILSPWSRSVETSHLATCRKGKRIDTGEKSSFAQTVDIRYNCDVLGIVFEGDEAVGVVVESPDGGVRVERPENGGEIILCAGTFETPRLLLRSGFTAKKTENADETININSMLSEHGIVPAKHRHMPDLGNNFQDHVLVPVMALGDWWTSAPVEKHRFKATCVSAYNVITQLFSGKLAAPTRSAECSSDEKEDEDFAARNCVHGWIMLDEAGNVLLDKGKIPR